MTDAPFRWIDRYLLGSLVAVDVLFVLVYIALDISTHHGVYVLFDLDKEGNLPTWYASSQLLIAGLLLLVFAVRNFYAPAIWIVVVLGLSMIAMSIDEAAGLHERIGWWSARVVGGRENTGFPKTGVWMFLVGVPFIAVLSLAWSTLSRVLAASAGAMHRYSAGFALLLAGAAGIEIVSNYVQPETTLAALQVATEELLELLGDSILLWSGWVLLRTHPSTQPIFEAVAPARAGRH
jgi:hypothetical protein